MRVQQTKGVSGRQWTRAVGVAACAAVVGLVAPAAAAAAGRQLLAPVGGGYGQTVRITVAAPEGVSCALSAGLLLPAQPVPVAARELELAPGQTGVLDVSLTRLVGRPGHRVELLPYTELRRGACLVSTEVFEQVTGRTMAISKGSIVGFDPQPDPPADVPVAAVLPAMGVASGQILRLGVARGFDPQPEPPGDDLRCVAVLAFADARGQSSARRSR
jgi:hypothetical protein